MKQLLPLLMGLFLITACTTTPSTLDPQRKMLGLGSNDPFWTDWQHRPPNLALPLANYPGELQIFDAWSITDKTYRNQLFDSLFVLIQSLLAIPGADHNGLEVILILLSESLLDNAHLELTFFDHIGLNHFEGIVLSVVDPRGTGLTLTVVRNLDAPPTPSLVTLRLEPGFQDHPGLALFASLANDDSTPSNYTNSWAPTADANPDQALPLNLNLDPYFASIHNILWHNVTHEASLNPPFDFTLQQNDFLATGWPAHLGLDLTDRGLQSLQQNSAFWPRQRNSPF